MGAAVARGGVVRRWGRRLGVGVVGAESLDFGEGAFELLFEESDAEEGFDASAEFDAVDGFGEEVVGAGFDGAFDVADFGEGGDHDDGDVACVGCFFEFFAELEAGHAGHHDVEEDEVGGALFDGAEGVEAVGGGADGAAEFFEVGLEEFEILFVVVDDEDGGV